MPKRISNASRECHKIASKTKIIKLFINHSSKKKKKRKSKWHKGGGRRVNRKNKTGRRE
jgi:hypothetical protein